MTNHHGLAALLTLVLGELGRLLLALNGTRVLAHLRVVFTGHKRPEESPLGHQGTAAHRTLFGRER